MVEFVDTAIDNFARLFSLGCVLVGTTGEGAGGAWFVVFVVFGVEVFDEVIVCVEDYFFW